MSDEEWISSDELPCLQRQGVTRHIDNWHDWIEWLKSHYETTQREIGERLGISQTMISHYKKGLEVPNMAAAVALASWAVDRGPSPPAVKLSPQYVKDLNAYLSEEQSEE